MSTAQRRLDKELRHNDIQFALGLHLIEQYGKHCVQDEFPTGNGTKVDLALKVDGRMTFYEIKTSESARGCIRGALGQLLEYAYWPGAKNANELIIVGEGKLDSAGKYYLDALRKKFSLPIDYKSFNLKTGKLR